MSGCHCVCQHDCNCQDDTLSESLAVDDLSYTLKRFGLVNKTVRSSWATELEILLLKGKVAVEEHRKIMNADDWSPSWL